MTYEEFIDMASLSEASVDFTENEKLITNLIYRACVKQLEFYDEVLEYERKQNRELKQKNFLHLSVKENEIEVLQRNCADKDAIINFLKKELIKKTSYRQVMKRQYRELKQKCDALERYIKEVENV